MVISITATSWPRPASRAVVVDPKGVVGEPAYETGAWLRDPARLLEEQQPGRILARRIDQLAEELELDRQRVWGWALG